MSYTTSRSIKTLLVLCFAIALAGCASKAAPQPLSTNTSPPPAAEAASAKTSDTFSDPFAYCAAVGTVDAPDARYSGPEMPDSILQGMIGLDLVSADAPSSFQQNAVWRCMDNQVWVCTFGANLPCLEKADTSQTPTQAMTDYCKENPTAEGIPAYVTGRATVYNWDCKDGQAVAGEQVFTPDAQGFLSDFWYELTPK
ncbi:MAG: hypothetical protein LC130_33515 [Bryobacterales bacterium]|nr:hypothetical protein [Bryobacterales bacterium]